MIVLVAKEVGAMRKTLVVAFAFCALALTLGLAACGVAPTVGSATDEPGDSKGLLSNHYVETEEILFGDSYESSDATLVLYEDGTGVLDFPLAFYEPQEVVFDRDNMLLYTVSDSTGYPVTLEGDLLTLHLDPEALIKFKLEEEGFSLQSLDIDAQAVLQAKRDEAYAASAPSVSEDGWIHIGTAEEFLHIADNLDGKYVLDADIDDWRSGTSTVFRPIGTPEKPFTGELDGNGHMITGTLAYTGQEEAWGIFGCNEGTIRDLTIGYIDCEELHERYMQHWEREYAYTTLDEEGFPTDATRYYAVLCGLNRGTIENVRFEDRTSVPDLCCFPNSNETIYVGVVCGYNDGTISGIGMLEMDLHFYTLDKYTALDIGLVCGYQSAKGVLENVRLELNNGIYLYGFGIRQNVAPVVNAGLMVGEAEGGTTVRSCAAVEGGAVNAAGMLAGAELCFGGLIGYVQGDIELSGIEMTDLRVYMDAQGVEYMSEQDSGYEPTPGVAHVGGGLIGSAGGNVTLLDIALHDSAVEVVLRPGGDPQPSYVGGMVGYCGGNLTARGLVWDGRGIVNANVEQGIAYAGGICGYCEGASDISESSIAVGMNPLFHGWVLYQSNVLGYACGDATITSSLVTCNLDEFTGESMGQSILADSASTYYLASLAGYAEGYVSVEGCTVDVVYTLFGTPGAVYYDDGLEGLYNAG